MMTIVDLYFACTAVILMLMEDAPLLDDPGPTGKDAPESVERGRSGPAPLR